MTLSSYWGQLSICIFGLIWLTIFMLGLYKLVKCQYQFSYPSHPYFSSVNTRIYLPNNVGSESRGLDTEVIQMLPMIKFEEGDSGKSNGTECSICLTEFCNGDWQRVLPSCSHAFHVRCIDMWFVSHGDCPLCRKQVVCDYSGIPMVRSLEPLQREDACGEWLHQYHVAGLAMV